MAYEGPHPREETTVPAPDSPLLWAWAVLVMSARDCDITEWRWSERGVLGASTRGAGPWP